MIELRRDGVLYVLSESEILVHLPDEVLAEALRRGKAIRRHREIARRGYRATQEAEAKQDKILGAD